MKLFHRHEWGRWKYLPYMEYNTPLKMRTCKKCKENEVKKNERLKHLWLV